MFIGISVAYFSTSTKTPDEYVMRFFDASRIVVVSPGPLPEHVSFSVDEGGYEGPSVYMTDSYDEGGLVELIMQARLNPAEYLPSRYVGKSEDAEPISTGSLRWKANPKKKA